MSLNVTASRGSLGAVGSSLATRLVCNLSEGSMTVERTENFAIKASKYLCKSNCRSEFSLQPFTMQLVRRNRACA